MDGMNPHVLQLAVDTAKTSPGKFRVGAVLLYRGRVVATATNAATKTHPLQARLADRVGRPEKTVLHAEVAALVRCRSQVDTIVVARVDKANQLRLSKPCPVCELAIREAGVMTIYYSTEDGFVQQYQP